MFLSLSEGKNPVYRLVHPNNYDDKDDDDGDGYGGGDDYDDDDQDTQRKKTSTMEKNTAPSHQVVFSVFFCFHLIFISLIKQNMVPFGHRAMHPSQLRFLAS